ncbi:rna binding protein [Moniliophthora roreri MCA 2997]|uniref:Rna binding protein n=1 Tax=Moniliophthora roreri (strain MCA 2997) TaxID=1381753 RepID=V2WN83_MONRO|nr:rna binding protein [Moniliophthora roreri MCA 2997]
METSVGEPFTLSTYSIPQRASKSGKSAAKLSEVYATHHSRGQGSSEGYVTVAAQGDGVHVLDLSNLHPIISHTLGPTIIFCCSPVSRSVVKGADHICTTYAGISSSSDTPEGDVNKTIWMWNENLSSSIADRASQKKRVVTLSHPISGLYTNPELPSRLLASSPSGGWTLLDDEMKVLATREATSSSSNIKQFIFSRQKCRYLPPHSTPAQAAIIISLLRSKDGYRISVIAVDADTNTFVELGDETLSIQGEICDISCSSTGFLSILTTKGYWYSMELKSVDDKLSLTALPDTLRLSTSLSFISSAQEKEVTIISLGSSHVLIAGLTKDRDIALLLWDLQFSVLLASRTIPLPSTLSSDKIAFQLADAMTSSSVLLVLSPQMPSSDRRKSSSSASATVLVVPVVVPPTSSIINAMGRAAGGAAWLAKEEGVGPSAEPYDAGRKKVIADMRSAMNSSRPQNANDAFFTWEKRELEAVASKKKNSDGGEESSAPRLVYGYAFVKDVLNIVLRPTQPQNVTYSSQVVRHLLEKKAVSTNMIESGLLPALRLRNDWSSISLAFTTVPDLRELEIIDTLRYVLARHRHTQQPIPDNGDDGDAMQIDTITPMQDDMPTLQNFLNLCIRYQVSQTPLRFALKRYLVDVDDIMCLLGVLDGWISQWTSREFPLLPSKKLLDRNEHGVIIVKSEQEKKLDAIPPLAEILFFLQTLLDISFINLVQSPSSHKILKRIQSRINSEITSIDEAEKLGGSLQVFAAAHTKAIKNAQEASEVKKAPVGDWRQRRKLAQDQAGMGIGLYQLEELVL